MKNIIENMAPKTFRRLYLLITLSAITTLYLYKGFEWAVIYCFFIVIVLLYDLSEKR